MAGINWIASRSFAMTVGDSELFAILYLDRFTFVVQNDSQDRFAACGGHASLRDDGVGLFQYSIDGIYLILI